MALPEEMALAGKYITEALNRYEAQVDDPVYPEYWAYEGQYHQAIGDLSFGEIDIVKSRLDFTGRAVDYQGKGTVLPLANYGISQDKYKTVTGVLAAEWTWRELRAEEQSRNNEYMTNIDTVATYRRSLDKGLREWMHYKAIFGESVGSDNFGGLLTNPYLEVINIPAAQNGITGTSATAETAYDWFLAETTAFAKASKLTAEGTAVLTSIDVMSALRKRFASNTSDGTALGLITGRTGNSTDSALVRTVNRVNEFSGEAVRDPEIGNRTALGGVNVAANADLLMMVDADVQNNLQRHFADVQTMAPYTPDGGMTYRQIGMCATSEVMLLKPFAARLYVLNKS